ncbi:MAG: hypothetical protein RIB93_18550 [Coleofasciculus sp. D1-CHI-01]|uniref:hypothetical protein n=1 Tax=Coleofasciculus sp. D1-CHI-01 TaxID=3068482 RepID=UPI003301E55B
MFSQLHQFQSSKLTHTQKALLKLQYQTVHSAHSATDDKFEAWLMTLEEQWTPEIAACLQGKFPDWRS